MASSETAPGPDALVLSDVCVDFPTRAGVVRASDHVDLRIRKGECMCLVGESGCGKSVLALSVPALLPGNALVSGMIRVDGEEVTAMSRTERRKLRAHKVSLILEQPTACLNPVMNVGEQIAEAVRASMALGRRQARSAALELLGRTGIPEPKRLARHYPHQLSGGMNQRVMIAMALASRPGLLVADEPTTALDPSVQVQIMELLRDVLDELKAALLLITHDLDVARELCTRAAVMYAGGIMETGSLERVFNAPRHPYARSLVGIFHDSVPRPIPGSPPPLTDLPTGCAFHPRCPHRREVCATTPPPWRGNRRCHL